MTDPIIAMNIDLDALGAATAVRDFPVTIKRIVTTDDGRIQIVIEAESLDVESRAQAHRLLELQRGTALLTLCPSQAGLFDEVSATEKAPGAK